MWGQRWWVFLLSDKVSCLLATQLYYLDVLSIWLALLVQDVPSYPHPFLSPFGDSPNFLILPPGRRHHHRERRLHTSRQGDADI